MKNIAKFNKFVDLVDEASMVISKLSQFWSEIEESGENDDMIEVINETYPLEGCFNELNIDMYRWSNELSKKLQELKQKQQEQQC